MPVDSKSLGKRLRAYRSRLGLSLETCSEQIGISGRYLADIERGSKVPTLETFLLILNVLSASADDVLQDSLLVGYEAKSNDILRKLSVLDVSQRKQALTIFEGVIDSMKKS